MSNYRLGGASAYWVFPSSIERLQEEVQPYEINKFAWQSTPGKLFILSSVAPITWTEVGSGGTAGAAPASFEQSFASSATWIVNHNLGREPFISVLTVGGVEMVADIQHTSINQSIVYFSSAQSGRIRSF